jgi:hypothetical protein
MGGAQGAAAGGRLDAEVDVAIDAGLDKLHETVVAKLGTIRCWRTWTRKPLAGRGRSAS